jgi:Mg-chelatase subunit ChlD
MRIGLSNTLLTTPMLLMAMQIAGGCGRSSPSSHTVMPDGTVSSSYTIPLDRSATSSREPDTIGLIFCLDVSGSMENSIDGKRKIDISKNAMRTVFAQIDSYVKAHPEKKVQVGLISFSSDASLVVPPAPFDRARLEQRTDALRPGGGTAIGDAMVLALNELHKSAFETRAMIVMSDGENNRGVPPEQAMQAIRSNRNSAQAPTDDVSVFLVAFDVKSATFQGVSQAGASVVESRDENSLREMLNTVVEEVLLEKQ